MHKTKIMGILNVTPDSCYDKGKHYLFSDAVQRGLDVASQGADILDIGGESTRPDSTPITPEEELERVIPVIEALKQKISIPISIDTRNPLVAQNATQAGASMINDITGFSNPVMREIAASSKANLCLMHMQGTPQTMQIAPFYEEGVIAHLLKYFETQIELLLREGVQETRIIIDPGIGFGKTVADNLEILENLPKLKAMGFPVLLGSSRKSFMGKILGKGYEELLSATIAINTIAFLNKVDIIRVHDVVEHQDAFKVLNALLGFKQP